ncbi:MAG: hypothetical protein ACP5F3_03425, partial [Candidatus Syntrophosphaera sp.]
LHSTASTTWLDPAFPQAHTFYYVTASTDAVALNRAAISGLENLPPKERRSGSPADTGLYNPGKRAMK